MDYDRFFSERTRRLRASEIRELLKLTQRSDIISFAGGLPNPLSFPVEEIRAATDRILRGDPELALQYGPTEGYTPLRDEIARHLNKDRFGLNRENICITNGSQQGLDLLGRVLLNAGDKVIVGNPTYLGALSAFSVYRPDFVAVASDKQGLRMDALEDTLRRLRKAGTPAKVVYTVPTFQNPSGTVLPLNRRRKLLDLSHEYDFLIIEDDPYGKLRYTGEHLPCIYALDKEHRTVYLGTFSKILVPGFRLAWAVGPEPLIRRIVISKQATDLCTNAFTQFIAADLMANDIVERHLPKIISLYAGKRQIMLDTMGEAFPDGVEYTRSEGGLFTWAELPRGIDTAALLKDALERKVAFVPGHAFYVDPAEGAHTMRLNFSHPSDEMIEEGVRRLGAVIENRMAKTVPA